MVHMKTIARLSAIYSLIFLSNGTLLLSPAIDTMLQAFPQEAYSKMLPL